MINNYYNCIMNCVPDACLATLACVPSRALNVAKDYVVPGWSDYVEEKHRIARQAFLNWVSCGRQVRQHNGPEFLLMKQSRAQLKLALRYCKQHEDAMRADAYANNLAHKDCTAFCNDVKRSRSLDVTNILCMPTLLGGTQVLKTLLKCG
jgi:hypothetical protein